MLMLKCLSQLIAFDDLVPICIFSSHTYYSVSVYTCYILNVFNVCVITTSWALVDCEELIQARVNDGNDRQWRKNKLHKSL